MPKLGLLLLLCFVAACARSHAAAPPAYVGVEAFGELGVGVIPEHAQICPEGDTCSWECPEGNCAYVCAGGATCNVECSGGGCAHACLSGATCNFECSGGGCSDGGAVAIRALAEGRADDADDDDDDDESSEDARDRDDNDDDHDDDRDDDDDDDDCH